MAQRLQPGDDQKTTVIGGMPVSGRTLNILILAAILVVSFVIASRGSDQWNMVLSYLNQQPFGDTDPVFSRDIGFYVFSLPFYVFVREELLVLLLFAGLVSFIWYIKEGGLQIVGDFLVSEDKPLSMPKINFSEKVGKHFLVLGAILVLLIAWGYHLKVYGLLYSTQGPAFGASYTDINIKIPAYRILIAISFLWCLFLAYSAFRPKIKLLLIGGGIWLAAILILAYGLPILVQKFVVRPNELAKESPYIAYNIDFTRKAYNLNNIKEVNFEVDDRLSSEEIKEQYNNYTGSIYGEFTFQGAYVYNIDLHDGFELIGRITHLNSEDMMKSGFYPEYEHTIVRSLYIEDTLYTISSSMIGVHSLEDLQEIALISLD